MNLDVLHFDVTLPWCNISSKNKLIVNTLVLLISECGSNISLKITVDQQNSQQVF